MDRVKTIMKHFFIIITILILLTSQAMAIRIVTGKDKNGELVIKEPQGKPMKLDHTNPKINLPPGLEHAKIVYPENENLPEELKMLGIESSEGNEEITEEVTEEAVPEDMAGLIPSKKEEWDKNTTPPLGVAINNPEDTQHITEMGETTTGYTASPPAEKNSSIITVLWFVMACIIAALIITILYVIAGKKKVEISQQT